MVASSCRYLRPTSFPSALEIGIVMIRLGRSSVRYQLAAFPRGGDRPHVVGRFVHVYADRHPADQALYHPRWRQQCQNYP
ncbi:hypothetical protein [Kribbella sp. YM55]|uniref:hypothetical protein n=1 Tax=Kribbella speibonae TaxID=1572660 RepID=UPI0013F49982